MSLGLHWILLSSLHEVNVPALFTEVGPLTACYFVQLCENSGGESIYLIDSDFVRFHGFLGIRSSLLSFLGSKAIIQTFHATMLQFDEAKP
jgi:hypothetical protein